MHNKILLLLSKNSRTMLVSVGTKYSTHFARIIVTGGHETKRVSLLVHFSAKYCSVPNKQRISNPVSQRQDVLTKLFGELWDHDL